MEALDWAIVLAFASLIPIFVFATVWSRRPARDEAGEIGMRSGHPEVLEERTRLRQIVADTVSNLPGCVASDGGLRFSHRGLPGRVAFTPDRTVIEVETGDLVRERVDVVTTGFPLSLFLRPGEDRIQVRGIRSEYERIFKNRAEEHVLLEIGVRYELRISPDGLTLRLNGLPQNGASLRYWMSCVLRIVDLLPGVEQGGRVQVSEVVNEIAADTICQVCGSSLASGALVHCAVCRTPHHEDCWQYARKCSTFGCTSARCIR